MPETIAVLELRFVKDLEKSSSGITVTFQDGRTGRAQHDTKNFDYWVKLLEKSRQRKHPVAIAIDGKDWIVDVARADEDKVDDLLPHGDQEIKVFFKGHDGVFLLRRDHPKFDRIYKDMERSKNERLNLWFVAAEPRLTITDVLATPH